jgi:hypothetical protein
VLIKPHATDGAIRDDNGFGVRRTTRHRQRHAECCLSSEVRHTVVVFCNRCGHRNASAGFCALCGAALEEAPTQRHPIVVSPSADEPPSPAPESVFPLLIVRRGPNAGSRFALVEGPTTLGREPTAVIFLNDITVSRRHAVIVRENDSCVVTDQGSLNGSYLNGRLLDRPAPLTHGDELQFGVFRLVYFYAGASTGRPPARRVRRSRD